MVGGIWGRVVDTPTVGETLTALPGSWEPPDAASVPLNSCRPLLADAP